MRKRLLITVSDDTSYLHGVRFVGSFFRSKSLVHLTLFYVAPHAHGADRGIRKDRLEMESSPSEPSPRKARHALQTASRMLCDTGFPAENVTTKFIFKELGTVKDIIRQARQGKGSMMRSYWEDVAI